MLFFVAAIGARQLVRITEGVGVEELALPKLQTAMLAEVQTAGSGD